ncbi:TPA: hypothetical protein N2D17_003588 [Salmonella enterica]|nr:hypothetical protein [Salmonella enterica]
MVYSAARARDDNCSIALAEMLLRDFVHVPADLIADKVAHLFHLRLHFILLLRRQGVICVLQFGFKIVNFLLQGTFWFGSADRCVLFRRTFHIVSQCPQTIKNGEIHGTFSR